MGQEPKIKTEEEIEYPVLGWKKVEEYIGEGTTSGLILALLEGDKLFNLVISKKGYPGKNLDEKINLAAERFSTLERLKKARQVRNTVIKKINYNLTTLDLEDGIAALKQAIIDLQTEPKKLSPFDKLLLYFEYYFPQKLKSYKIIVLYIALFLVGVWFFANTSFGQAIVNMVVFLTNWIFSWVFAIFLVIIAIGIIAGGSILYFERRRRNR